MRKLIFTLLICCTSAAFAQKTNFSGNWKLDTTKASFKTPSGDAPKNVIPWSISVDQKATQMILTSVSLDSTLTKMTSVVETLPFDGTPVERKNPEKNVTASMHWFNDQSFSITRSGWNIASETW